MSDLGDAGAQAALFAETTVLSDWRDTAESALDRLIKSGELFTVEDVRDVAKDLGGSEPAHVNAWGGLIKGAAKAGRIRPDGTAETTRQAAHGRLVRVWRGCGR